MNTCGECGHYKLCKRVSYAAEDEEACKYFVKPLKCESCKHYNNGFCESIDGLTGAVKKEDYCSRGERKEV